MNKIVVNLKRFVLSSFVILVISSLLIVSAFAQNIHEEATLTINEAEQSMAKAFDAILDAEKIEANVSSLLDELNDATDLLSKAHMAFDNSDFSEAKSFAESSNQISVDVLDDAQILEVKTSNLRNQNAFFLLVTSFVLVPITVFGCFVGYRFFKRYYYSGLSKLKPRVD